MYVEKYYHRYANIITEIWKELFVFTYYSDTENSSVRIEYINPFVNSAFNVLKEVLGVEVRRGDILLHSKNECTGGVIIIVYFHGDFKGHVLLHMTEKTAISLVSLMLENMQMDPVKELDEMGRATITELANMITGRSVANLSKFGFEFELTPPKILVGETVKIVDETMPHALVIPMILPMGDLEIMIAMREEKNVQ